MKRFIATLSIAALLGSASIASAEVRPSSSIPAAVGVSAGIHAGLAAGTTPGSFLGLGLNLNAFNSLFLLSISGLLGYTFFNAFDNRNLRNTSPE